MEVVDKDRGWSVGTGVVMPSWVTKLTGLFRICIACQGHTCLIQEWSINYR